MFKRKPVRAAIEEHWINCLVCGTDQFWDRNIQLNTSGLEFLGLEWANAGALGLICTRCGFVHEFAGGNVQLYEAG